MHNLYFSRYSNSFVGNCLVSQKYFVENVSSPPEAADRSRWMFLLMARRAQWARLGAALSRGRLTLSPGQGASPVSRLASSVT